MNEAFMHLLQRENMHLGRLLPRIVGKKVTEYVEELIIPQQINSSEISADRIIVAEVIKDSLLNQVPEEELNSVVSQFSARPVIQTGDHCELIYDPQAFTNNLLYQISMDKASQGYLLTQQCSTPRMIQGRGPIRGPGFIRLESGIYRIFNRSKGNLKDCNVATTGKVTFTFEPEDPDNTAKLPSILIDLKGESFGDATSAIIAANRFIWANLDIPNKRPLLLFEESLSSDILAKFLEAQNHPLHSLYFDPALLSVFRKTIKKYTDSPECLILKNTSDFFWARYKEELIPVKLNEGATLLVSDIPKKPLEIEYSPQSIIESLRNRSIYPNLISSFLAISVFPQITVIGGISQYEYMFEIQEILKQTFEELGLNCSYLKSLTMSPLSTFVGIVGEDQPSFIAAPKLDRHTNIRGLIDMLLEQKVEDCLGGFEKFGYLEYYFDRRRKKEFN